MALSLKLCISDLIIVKPKCVSEANDSLSELAYRKGQNVSEVLSAPKLILALLVYDRIGRIPEIA